MFVYGIFGETQRTALHIILLFKNHQLYIKGVQSGQQNLC